VPLLELARFCGQLIDSWSGKEVGQDVLFYVRAAVPRLQASTTTESQYDRACLSFAENPRPPGPLLHWVCRD